MFNIDVTSDEDYFIILKNGKEFVKVKKANNNIEEVKKHFEIEKEV